MEQWKREYEEREHQRLREGITCSGKAEEEERSSQSETQHGKNMRSPTSSLADPEESSETNPEELMAELRGFTKDLDKTLQELKENIDRGRKDMEEEMKNLQMRERQLQEEREREEEQKKDRHHRSKTYDVKITVKGKAKTSPLWKDLRSRTVVVTKGHPSSSEEEGEEEKEESTQYPVYTEAARSEEAAGHGEMMAPLMAKGNTGERYVPWTFMDLTGLIN